MSVRHLHSYATLLIGTVWVFHGLYSKILNGIPRHGLIIERILGSEFADPARYLIGGLEIFLGLWVFTRRCKTLSAIAQTFGIIAMNTIEIILARDLLISAIGMLILNTGFIALIWWWVYQPRHATN